MHALGMDVPRRLRRERLALLLDALARGGLEACLADHSPVDLTESPGIEAKIRLKRAQLPQTQDAQFGLQVIEQLPGGGMADCFKVRDRDGHERFLKRVRVVGVDADALAREVEIYAKLERSEAEHVVRLVECLRSGEYVGLLMELATGGTLAEYCEERGELSTNEVCQIGVCVAAGLRELHAVEIVHRDLKPSNVLRSGDAWKLADFGISKNLARLITRGRTFQQSGTLGYAPPEQWDGRQAHPSADVYAFGKLLVFLLTGETDIDKVESRQFLPVIRGCTQLDPSARWGLPRIEEALRAL